jgi:hypothetical protein
VAGGEEPAEESGSGGGFGREALRGAPNSRGCGGVAGRMGEEWRHWRGFGSGLFGWWRAETVNGTADEPRPRHGPMCQFHGLGRTGSLDTGLQ